MKAVLAANPEAAKEKDHVRAWRALEHEDVVVGARGGHGGGVGARGEMTLGPHAFRCISSPSVEREPQLWESSGGGRSSSGGGSSVRGLIRACCAMISSSRMASASSHLGTAAVK